MSGEGMDRTWIEIDTDALAHNISALRGMLPAGCELSAVVKANASDDASPPPSFRTTIFAT